MEEKVLDTANEVVKNGTADLVLIALICISIAVTVIGAIYILNKYFHINKISSPLKQKIEEQNKMITNLCTGVEVMSENNNELRHEVKEIKLTQVEHTKLIDKISTHMEVQTQLLMKKL